MNHFTWIYVDDTGIQHHVGLYHGPSSGHVLIYCDANIVSIDFGIFDTKTYTFFIEDELFDLRLERRADKMFYFFEINKQTDTPRNVVRRKTEIRQWIQSGFLLAGLLLLALLIYFLLKMLKPE